MSTRISNPAATPTTDANRKPGDNRSVSVQQRQKRVRVAAARELDVETERRTAPHYVDQNSITSIKTASRRSKQLVRP
jgi:hypothetical protein